jgi:hypothetical protein
MAFELTPMEDAALLQSDPIASQRRFHSPNPRAKRHQQISLIESSVLPVL